jgi:1-acyl-sn-glycerol-3-phosphate acyltransferase
MKKAKNISPLVKIFRSLKEPNRHRKILDEARAAGDFELERTYLKKIEHDWGYDLIKKFGVELEVIGKENFPEEGPVVYVSNHQGYADIPMLLAAIEHLPFGFVARENLRKIPFIGPWMERIHCVFMRREDPRAALNSIKEGAALIEQGYSLVIFPEGTRAKDGPMAEFKPGALKLATKPKAVIVPISINGTYEMYEKDGYFHGSAVKVMAHAPIKTAEMSRSELKELPDRVHEIIRNGLETLKSEKKEG